MSELTFNDYKNILEFYKKPLPKSKRILKNKAEKLLATKLCRCIKKVDKKNEARAIGICTKTVINNKGYSRGNFTCKKKPTIKLSKKNITKRNKV
ncbi:MAG: hypothetical protein ACO310_06650 [Burkholderiaceae bacterium]